VSRILNRWLPLIDLEVMLIICEGSDGSVTVCLWQLSEGELCDGPNQQAPHNAWAWTPKSATSFCGDTWCNLNGYWHELIANTLSRSIFIIRLGGYRKWNWGFCRSKVKRTSFEVGSHDRSGSHTVEEAVGIHH
jgi:hypothetical protein